MWAFEERDIVSEHTPSSPTSKEPRDPHNHPFSSFLFMEGLHNAFADIVGNGTDHFSRSTCGLTLLDPQTFPSLESEDTCIWNVGPNGTFTVKDARNIIDQKTLPSLSSTSWDKVIPRKEARGIMVAKFPLSKLYLLRHLKIGYPLGMALKEKNTGISINSNLDFLVALRF
ncbi:hypothetical protein Tco_0748495 [Tanacetum coccineum]|uniref:Uncharacterized protein n=1 Tax=Tanacetum coccineum TaxID=301880 RepID=A0ABQ4YVT2_9ASTR